MKSKTAEEFLIEKFGETPDKEIVKQMADACREYADQFKPKWISVNDHLPHCGPLNDNFAVESDNVLLLLEDGYMIVGHYQIHKNPIYCLFHTGEYKLIGVTHWMPLPEKP